MHVAYISDTTFTQDKLKYLYKDYGKESTNLAQHEGLFGDSGKNWQVSEPMFCDQSYKGNLVGADLGGGIGWGNQSISKELWKIKPEGFENFYYYCKNNHPEPGTCPVDNNKDKDDFCRYGALRTDVIPFNKVWSLGAFGKNSTKGNTPPIFKVFSKEIDGKRLASFKVGWFNNEGVWKGFGNINPYQDGTWSRNTNKNGLWDNTDNTVTPGILKFEEGGGITVVTQWPAVVSDKDILNDEYRGIKFYIGMSSDQHNTNTDNFKSNEEFFKISQF